MDPYTGRVTEHYANAAFAAIAGVSAADYLDRVAAHDLPPHMTPFDHLCRHVKGGLRGNSDRRRSCCPARHHSKYMSRPQQPRPDIMQEHAGEFFLTGSVWRDQNRSEEGPRCAPSSPGQPVWRDQRFGVTSVHTHLRPPYPDPLHRLEPLPRRRLLTTDST